MKVDPEMLALIDAVRRENNARTVRNVVLVAALILWCLL
jgi:hypothetical protein